MAAPVLPADVLEEAIPGNIRNAQLFLRLMRTVVTYLKVGCGAVGTAVSVAATLACDVMALTRRMVVGGITDEAASVASRVGVAHVVPVSHAAGG